MSVNVQVERLRKTADAMRKWACPKSDGSKLHAAFSPDLIWPPAGSGYIQGRGPQKVHLAKRI